MKKFVLKASIFVLPFIALFILNSIFYNPQEGDLIRIGYLYSNPTPKSLVKSKYDLPKRFKLLSEIDIKSKSKFDVAIIGDSFSEQERLGYKNFLGNKGVSVLHIDRFISGNNPIQTLIQLLNSNIFNNISVDYIVLQSIERFLNQLTKNIDYNMTIDLDSLSHQIDNNHTPAPTYALQFFSNTTFKIPLTNLQYLTEPKPRYSQTYKYKSNSNSLFSNSPDDLLFYQDDIDKLNVKNDSLAIANSISVIENISNIAASHNIKLIMLVSPDKYDLYYPYIANNGSLNKPLFFEMYEASTKGYTNVDSYKILSEGINRERDIYFYDDSHWAPIGANIIADEIHKIISN